MVNRNCQGHGPVSGYMSRYGIVLHLQDFCGPDKDYRKYKQRLGDVVRDDSGSYAVFSEQRSSASHMTAAKVLHVISRLPVFAGEASDAMSAYTHLKMEGAPD